MRKTEEYLAKAAEFEREAGRVSLDVHRKHYLTLAAAWRDLAVAAETSATLQDDVTAASDSQAQPADG